MAHRIVSREEARLLPPLRPPLKDDLPWDRLWLHHSAGSMGDAIVVRDVQRYHQSLGWRDIAYNLVVGLGGIYEGMGVGNRHLNSDAGRSGTILLLGNFEVRPVPQGMIERTAWLVAHGLLSGWWKAEARSGQPHLTGGHRDVPGAKGTLCPGRYALAAIPEINRRAANMIHTLGATPVPNTPTKEEEEEMWFILHDSHPESKTANVHYLIDEGQGEVRILSQPADWISTADGGLAPMGFRKKSVPFAGRVVNEKLKAGKYTLLDPV